MEGIKLVRMLEPAANVAAEVMCIPKERQGPEHTKIKVKAKNKQKTNKQWANNKKKLFKRQNISK